MPKRTHRAKIRKQLLDRIESMKKANRSPHKGGFIGEDYLVGLFQPNNIRPVLQEDFPRMKEQALDSLCTTICDRHQKTFTILILAEKTEAIASLCEDQSFLDDEALFNAPFLRSEPYRRGLFPWKRRTEIADILYQKQWLVPPRLSNSVHQIFPVRDFIFPFSNKPEMISYGSFGAVYSVDIAGQHLEYPQGFDSTIPKVYKCVKRESHRGYDWDRLLNEVNTLRAREHSHITPLLASFSAGNVATAREDDMEELLYMILPFAEGNMKTWMESEPAGLHDTNVRQECIYRTMLNVASGLAFIHKEINGKVGFHHDIKPSNILRFPGTNGSLPVWKICDFGGSNLKNKDDTGSSFDIGTALYAPPEFFIKDGRKKGRAFDVFSLGVVFLELATLWKFGWAPAGLQTLLQQVQSRNNSLGSNSHSAYCKKMDVVYQWITMLGRDDSKKFSQVLSLVKEMLKSEPKERIFVWEVEIDLFWLIEPDRPLDDIIGRLREIAQESNKHINGIATGHNPLRRAKRLERPTEYLYVLKLKRWSDSTPGTTKELQGRFTSTERLFSTLDVPKDKSPLYGRFDDMKWLEDQFAETHSLGLYGLGGVGKSHIALEYALQFEKTEKVEAKKHTFWINANSLQTMIESFEEIARAVLSDTPPDKLSRCKAAKKWLEEAPEGPWFMVIDGLDSHEVASKAVILLPRQATGQILITARNRETLLTVCNDSTRCRNIRPPEQDVSLKIFRHYLEDIYYDEDLEGTYKLLHTLFLPLVIKMAATYMNKYEKPNSEMQKNLAQDGLTFTRIDEFEPSPFKFMTLFLRPLFQLRVNRSSGLPPELKLLVFLACLSNEKIGIKLIRANYEEDQHASVDTRLGTLVNCAFIEKFGDDSYRTHKFVQDGVIAWIRNQKKEVGLFRRLAAALTAMLIRYNDKKKNEYQDRTSLLHVSSYKWQRPFMPHFSRFMDFARGAKKRGLPDDFQLDIRAVECIETFSHAYYEEGRFNEAVEVLDFANKHCNGGYQANKRVFQIKTKLIRTLALAKIRRGKAFDAREAVNLLNDRIQDVKDIVDKLQESERADYSILEWELLLDMVRLTWKSGFLNRAWDHLKRLEPLSFQNTETGTSFRHLNRLKPLVKRKSNNDKKIRQIAIRARREEGLVYLAAGKRHARDQWPWSPWLAIRSLKTAKDCFLEAKKALKNWLEEECEELVDIEESIVDANLMIGSPECLQEAEVMLLRHIQDQRDIFHASEKRIWDTEYKLAEVRIKGDEEQVQKAIQMLKPILNSHTELFGQNDAETRSFATLLRNAYQKAGARADISTLEDDFGLQPNQVGGSGQASYAQKASRKIDLADRVLFLLAYIVLLWRIGKKVALYEAAGILLLYVLLCVRVFMRSQS